jgi:L-threonylcarbamoyladenylate synthase
VRTRILPVSKSSIQEACQILLAGELVAFPTETVYGLGGLGLSSTAVLKIFEAKGRPSTDPLILHLASSDLAQAVSEGILASPIPEPALFITRRFWPGPLTLILPKGPRVPTEVTSGLETVAVRCPSDICIAPFESIGSTSSRPQCKSIRKNKPNRCLRCSRGVRG